MFEPNQVQVVQGLRQESVVCPGCGCLCDDLDVTLEGGRIVQVANVCRWGASKFLDLKKFHPKKERRRVLAPQVRGQGRGEEVSYEEALGRAAEILNRARRPLIYGLTNLGSRAQAAALRLARGLGARLEPADLAFMAPYYQSVKEHGLYLAPLEVVRDQAEAVLYWGANPLHSCSRHPARYAVFARGRFTERGLEDRRVAAVDLYRSEMARFCHLFVTVAPEEELALLQGVRAVLERGPKLKSAVRGTRRLADFLAQASYGVVFLGRGLSYQEGPARLAELAGLVASLNARAPFVMFPLLSDFNASGLYQLLLREVGAAGAADFGAGEAVIHSTPVDFRQVDAILVAGADLFWFLKEEEVQDLKRRQVPVIVLSPFVNRTTGQAQVVFPVALAGIEAEEVAHRMDGLPVALRPLVPSGWPADQQVLADLELFR